MNRYQDPLEIPCNNLELDPDFLVWDAENEAREDFDKGISLLAGMTKLRVRGSSEAELHAYLTTYQTNRMAADMGLAVFLPHRPF